MPKDWYSIQAKKEGDETIAEIRIYDEIGFWGVTAKSFAEELTKVSADASRVVVSLNSPGGSVFDAFAIYNMLMRSQIPVTTRVDGVAASAASLIFMAGGERVMPENAMLMVHNAWTVAAGTAEDLRSTADMMDKVRDGIVSAYARSGKNVDEILALMDATTWMDALEAQSMGFATVMEEPVRLVAHASALERLEEYDGVPQELLASLQENQQADEAGQDASPPEPAPSAPPDAQANDGGADGASNEPASTQDPVNSSSLITHVYAECRKRRVPHLAESVLVSASLTGLESVNARLADAEAIAGICLAAKLQDKAGDFVAAGLSVEQVRARLFDHVVQASESIHISNLQRPDEPADLRNQPSIQQQVYGARAAQRRITQH